MKIKQTAMRRCLWLWLLTFFAVQVSAQSFKDGMQQGVLRIKVKPELMMSNPQGLKTKMLNDVATTGIKALDELSEQYDVKSIERVFRYSPKHEAKHQKYGLHLWYTVTFNANSSPLQIARAYTKLSVIESAEPIFEKSVVPYSITELKQTANKAATQMPFNDPYLDKQWHYNNTGQNDGTPGCDINLFKTWEKVAGNPNVIVSIHDNGLDITHEDLIPNLWVNQAELNGKKNIDDDGNGYRDDIHGFNFGDNSSIIAKGDHGTHVAGTVAAVSNNGIGVSGVAGGTGSNDGVKLMACQILGGTWSDLIAESFIYAADNGAIISQNSWGYHNPYSFEQVVLDAIDYFIAEAGSYEGSPMKGGVVIFASGNSSINLPMYPGYYKPVIAVSAIGPRFEIAPYSNFGDWVDISAPGGNGDWGFTSSVLSTIPNNKYGYMDGTSMACPHVSGIAALVVSMHGGPGYTNEMLKKALLTGVTDQIYHTEANAAYKGALGSGMSDAFLSISKDQKKAPKTIADLTIKGMAQDFASIQWSVPEDEDDIQPVEFELFYSKKPINTSDLTSATSVKIRNTGKAGEQIEYEVEGLEVQSKYYFAVRSTDRWGNTSALSNEVSGTTNKGPKIVVDKKTLTSTINVATSSAASVTFNISNTDEGILKWNGEVRHVNSQDYNRTIQYPKATVKSAKAEIGMLKVLESQEGDSPAVPYGQQTSDRKFQYFDPFSGLFVIGETNLKLTNSMASRFVVNSAEGFNLTNVQILLKHSNTTGPVIFEVRVGENLNDAKIVYAEERKTQKAEAATISFALKEQIFFPQGTTFWMVTHVPAGNLYPLGASVELQKDLSDNCFYSSDMGSSWKKLEDVYFDNRLVWAMVPQEKLVAVDKFVELTPNSGNIEFNGSDEVTVNVDASQLVNGTYNTNIIVNSNDKSQPIVRIPYKIEVRGHKPQIVLPEIIDMGSCLLGQSITKTIEINNTGLGALASATYKFSNPLFKVKGIAPATVTAKTTQQLTVEFKPTKSGNENCTLTIKDINGVTIVTNLFAVTAEPPVMEISPKNITYTDLMAGTTQDGSFTLRNSGKYPLKYYFPSFAGSTVQTEQNKYLHIYGYQHSVTTEETDLAWNDISTIGTDHTKALKNYSNNYVAVELGFGFPFFGKEEKTGYITRYGVFAFDTKSTFNVQPLYFKADETNDRFISALGLGLDMSGNARIFSRRFNDHFIVQYQDCGISEFDWSTGEKITIPITFQIILFDNGDIEFKYKDVDNLDEDMRESQVYIGIEDKTKSDGLCINEYAYKKLMIQDNVRVHISNSGYGAVDITGNASGTLMVGQSVQVPYTINTDKLSIGNFTEKVAVISNDPVTPMDYVVFNVSIKGGDATMLEADKTEIDFGKVFQGGDSNIELKIENTGEGSATINSVSFTGDRFTSDISEIPYIVKYRHNLYLNIELNTEEIGVYDDVLTISYGTDKVIEIPLKGEVTPAPAISSSIDMIEETLDAGDSKQLSLTITNDGGHDLAVAPKGNEWVYATSANAAEGSFDYSLSTNKDGATDAMFNWIDITDGHKIPVAESPDEYFTEVRLPWEISFYGKKYTTMYVQFNGWISFEKFEYQDVFYFGQPDYAPSTNLPNNYIAPGWGYVGPVYREVPENEGCYIKSFPDKIVVSFVDYINGFGMGDPMSYQIIFYKNGLIKLQYKLGIAEMTVNRLGVSCENEDGTKGVQISYYQEDITDKQAFILTPYTTHTIAPGESAEFTVTVDASTLIGGEYNGALKLANNTPDESELAIPATLTVNGEAVIESETSIDLGEIVIDHVLDQYGDESYRTYYQDFDLKNVGKGALEINSIEMENPGDMATTSWINIMVSDVWGSKYEWVMTDDIFSLKYPMVLLPGDKIRLRMQVAPTEMQSAIADNMLLDTNIGTHKIALTATAIMPPQLELDEEGVTVIANNRTFNESRSLTLSNANGLSDLKLSCELIFDRGQEASKASPAMMRSSSEPAQSSATLQSVPAANNAVARTSAYTAASDERVISYTDKDRADNFIGFGGGVEFDAAISFKAPSNGFNLTDVMNYMSLEANTKVNVTVSILAGKDINTASKLYRQTYEVNNETGGTDKGAWRRFKLDQNQIMLPGETFHVVFSYPSEIKFPMGIVELNNDFANKCFYYDVNNSRWSDFTSIDAFQKRTYLAKAIETNYINAAWVELEGEPNAVIPAGEQKDLKLNFKGAFSKGAENAAYLIVRSNDTKNKEVEVPVRMIMNQAPIFELGTDAYFTVNENELLDVIVGITDKEGDAFTVRNNANIKGLTATAVDNGMAINYKPDFNDAGIHKFVVIATDTHNNESECTVHITVNNTNRAPRVVSPIGDKTYRLKDDNAIIAFEQVFADPDGDTMTFEVTNSDKKVVECFTSESSLYIKPLNIGTCVITITAKDAGNQVTTTSFKIEVKNRVGIDELVNAEIRVYPIPADDYVFVQWTQLIPGNVKARLNTTDGKLISETEIETSKYVGEIKISLTGQPSGIYFVELISENESIIKKILKK